MGRAQILDPPPPGFHPPPPPPPFFGYTLETWKVAYPHFPIVKTTELLLRRVVFIKTMGPPRGFHQNRPKSTKSTTFHHNRPYSFIIDHYPSYIPHIPHIPHIPYISYRIGGINFYLKTFFLPIEERKKIRP